MLFSHATIQPVRQAGIEDHLDQDRHRQHGDHERLAHDGFALEREQQHQRQQQRGHGERPDPRQRSLECVLPATQQGATPELSKDHGDHDVQPDRNQQRIPGHGDGRQAKQQADNRCKGEHHDRVVQRNLRQCEYRITAGQPAPHEHHGRTRGGGKQDQTRYVAIQLVGRQPGGKDLPDEQPPQERHGERLDRPVDEQRYANTTPMLLDLAQGLEVHLQKHRDDHHPDQHAHGQIDLRDLQMPDGLK